MRWRLRHCRSQLSSFTSDQVLRAREASGSLSWRDCGRPQASAQSNEESESACRELGRLRSSGSTVGNGSVWRINLAHWLIDLTTTRVATETIATLVFHFTLEWPVWVCSPSRN